MRQSNLIKLVEQNIGLVVEYKRNKYILDANYRTHFAEGIYITALETRKYCFKGCGQWISKRMAFKAIQRAKLAK